MSIAMQFPTGTATRNVSVRSSPAGGDLVAVWMGSDWQTLTLSALATQLLGAAATIPPQFPSAGVIQDANGNTLIGFPATVASAVNYLEIDNAATLHDPALAAKGTDADIGIDLLPKGDGPVRAGGPLVDKRTKTATTDTATITADQILTKVLDATPTAPATYTLDTAALLVAAIPGCKVGDSFSFLISNVSLGANTITVAAGSGGTAHGPLTVAQNATHSFHVVITNVTPSSEAYHVYG